MSDVYKSGMRGSEKPKAGPLKQIRIEIAGNGYVVHHAHEDARAKNGQTLYGSGDQKKPKVFEDIDGLLGHLKEALKK